MPRQAMPLSAKRVESLTSEGQVQRDVADGLVPGLGLRISQTGRKTWVLSYKAPGGIGRRMKLGSFPITSLSDARDRARAELAKVQQGKDPAAEREDQRAGRNSFRTMAQEIPTQNCKLVARGPDSPSW